VHGDPYMPDHVEVATTVPEQRSTSPVTSSFAASTPRFSYLLKQVERAGRAQLDKVSRHHGITAAQYTALSVLARHPGMSSAQLGRRSFASAQSANEIVSALLSRHLIARQVDPSNRRVLGIYLTASGKAVLEACDAEVDAMEERILEQLTPAERNLIRSLLARCLDAMVELPTPAPGAAPLHGVAKASEKRRQAAP